MSAAPPTAAPALRLVTPEGVALRLPLAGPVARALALSVDYLVIFAATWIVGIGFRLLGVVLPALGSWLGMLTDFALFMGYAAALEWAWNGQTIGKRLLEIRVADERGLPLLGSQVLVRNLLRVLDALPLAYLVGGAACLLSRHAQRLGDQVAGTVVIRGTRVAEPDAAPSGEGKYNSLAACRQLALRMRERATPAEAQLVRDALRIRDRLTPATRLGLYRELMEYFQGRVAFPAEVVEGLSPEQYLRDLAAVLFPGAG